MFTPTWRASGKPMCYGPCSAHVTHGGPGSMHPKCTLLTYDVVPYWQHDETHANATLDDMLTIEDG